jgi:hypothetical protein
LESYVVLSYPTSGRAVSLPEQRIRIVSHFYDRKDFGETAQDVADKNGISRASLYQYADRAREALLPRKPVSQP